MRSWGKKILKGMLILILMAIGFIACTYWWIKPPASFEANTFNKKVWDATDGLSATWSCRWQMADDIQKRWLRPGMERKDVVALLGKPDVRMSEKQFQYNLGDWGPKSPFSVYYTLDVNFDQNGHMAWTDRSRHTGKVGIKKDQTLAGYSRKLGKSLQMRKNYTGVTDKEPTGDN